MGWESKVANQMLSSSCLFKNRPSWMALLPFLLLFSSYLLVGFGYFSILSTSLVVVFSTVLCTVSKHKAVEVDELGEEKVLSPEDENSDQREDIAPTPLCKHETVTEAKEAQDDANMNDVANCSTPSPDLISESEFQDQLTSEDAEVDWPIRYAVDHSPDDCSDGSISDEESLIEIALPSGHYVGQQKEEPKYNCRMQQKKRELSAEALFSHQSLMEFLSELNDVNEEENLIEIDISMGSIKYSSKNQIPHHRVSDVRQQELKFQMKILWEDSFAGGRYFQV